LCCSVLYCSVMPYVVVCCSVLQSVPRTKIERVPQCVPVCCCLLRCLAVCILLYCSLYMYLAPKLSSLELQQRGLYVLQHIAIHCNTLQHTIAQKVRGRRLLQGCNTLPHTATHCSTLQHTTTQYHTPRAETGRKGTTTLQHTAPVIEQPATQCNTLHNLAQKLSGRGLLGRGLIFGRSKLFLLGGTSQCGCGPSCVCVCSCCV